ncbi:MAG: hypothetical protein JRI68_26295 [Deltaproteobacteria bacterium]|nr:hypothetical protein [Deltaproteobacteria bacterium]
MALLLACLAAPLACSRPQADGGTASGASTSAPKPAFDVDGFCEQTMAMPSDRTCEGDDEIIEGNKAGYCVTELVAARDEGRITFDAGQAAACVKAVSAATPPLPDRRTLRDLGMRFEACRGAAVGKQGAGAECKTTMECVAGLRCVSAKCAESAKADEACVPLKEVSLSNVTSSCAPGLHCEASQCQPLVGEGKPCSSSGACQPSLRCRDGKCTKGTALTAGAACEEDVDCGVRGHCAKEGKTTACRPRKPAGTKCVLGSECLGRCSRKDRQCVSYCGSG